MLSLKIEIIINQVTAKLCKKERFAEWPKKMKSDILPFMDPSMFYKINI